MRRCACIGCSAALVAIAVVIGARHVGPCSAPGPFVAAYAVCPPHPFAVLLDAEGRCVGTTPRLDGEGPNAPLVAVARQQVYSHTRWGVHVLKDGEWELALSASQVAHLGSVASLTVSPTGTVLFGDEWPVAAGEEAKGYILWAPSSPGVSHVLRMDNVCFETGWARGGTMLYGERDGAPVIVSTASDAAGEVVAAVPALPRTRGLWEPSGSLLFVRRVGERQQVWRTDPATGAAEAVGPKRASVRLLALSPEGDRALLATQMLPPQQQAGSGEPPEAEPEVGRPGAVIPIHEALETLSLGEGRVRTALQTDWYIEDAVWPVDDVVFALTTDMAWRQTGRFAPNGDRVCRIELDTGDMRTIAQPWERIWLVRDLRYPLPEVPLTAKSGN